MAKTIDKQTMLDLIVEAKRTDPETGSFAEWLAEYLAEHLPTLTPPNEWVNAKDNPPQLTGKYICCVEDTHGYMWSIPADYLLEMKTWVGEFGEIKNKVVYWMPLPAPPDSRPPEGEEDT